MGILPPSTMRFGSKTNLNQLLKTGSNNTFKDLLIKMQFSKPALSRDLRILESLNKEPVWEFLP